MVLKRVAIFVALAVGLVVGGCESLPKSSAQKGVPFFSWSMTDTSFHGKPKQRTGYYFFIDPADQYSGDSIVIEKWRNGRFLDSSRTGIDLKELKTVRPEPFDLATEIKAVVAKGGPEIVGLDGAVCEATYVYDGVRFRVSDTSLSDTVKTYAPWNRKIARFNAFLDFVFLKYGRARAEIYDSSEYN